LQVEQSSTRKLRLMAARVAIRKGADINSTLLADIDDSPMLHACGEGDVSVVRMLIEAGADVNLGRTKDGCSPLYIAAQEGSVAVVHV